MSQESLKSYLLRLNSNEADRIKEDTQIVLNQDGVHLKFDRWAFGQYAAVDMSFIKTRTVFQFVPKDEDHGVSEPTISCQTAISGHANGTMPGGQNFVLNKEWGLLTDYAEGYAEFLINPGEPLRSIGGILSKKQFHHLFNDEVYRKNVEEIIGNIGITKSYRITPAMRMLARNAINIPLHGPLKRMYLEGTSLQLFALILDQTLEHPFVADQSSSRMLAQKKAISDIADHLFKDLANPPSLIELSEVSGLSIYKINSGFKKYFGGTAFEILTRKRLEAARTIIEEDPKFSLKQLSQNLGYDHLSNFVAAFKREFGVTPGQYLKSLKK